MTYHGNVHPGGPPAVRELTGLSITKISVGPMDNNAYVLTCVDSAECVLIDAANEPDRLLPLLPNPPVAVITTHQHPDHWQGLSAVVKATGAATIAGTPDVDGIPVATTRGVWDDDEINFGSVTLRVIGLVGHTPGSIALVYDDPFGPPHLWTGDCLFPGGVGRTRSPEQFASLLDDVEHKLFDTLPDETWVYPGHGNDTTLGRERPSLNVWRARGW